MRQAALLGRRHRPCTAHLLLAYLLLVAYVKAAPVGEAAEDGILQSAAAVPVGGTAAEAAARAGSSAGGVRYNSGARGSGSLGGDNAQQSLDSLAAVGNRILAPVLDGLDTLGSAVDAAAAATQRSVQTLATGDSEAGRETGEVRRLQQQQQQQQQQQKQQRQQQQAEQRREQLDDGGSNVGRSAQALPGVGGGGGKEAYVTLLYGEAFMLGVRVLGQSLRDTGTTRELVVLCAGALSSDSEDTLVNEGWAVRHVDAIRNPGMWQSGASQSRTFPPRFWAVYTKLAIFNMTEYSKVVFLDADTVVTRNMDEAFGCPGFCAAMRHSERLNSGVLVVQPSAHVFRDMLSKIAQLPSYTGGDQGFLNSYFYGFADAPLFDPRRDYGGGGAPAVLRLPTRYNADLGLYIINGNKWGLPESEIRVMHFTLGVGKPWHWFAQWLVPDLMPLWTDLRERLPRTPHGERHGDGTGHAGRRWLLFPAPFLITAALIQRLLLRHHGTGGGGGGRGRGLSHVALQRTVSMPAAAFALPPGFQAIAVGVGFACFVVAAGIVLLIVPIDLRPRYAWPLAFEWLLFVFLTLQAAWFMVCYHWGGGAAAAGGGAAGIKAAGGRPIPGYVYEQHPWRRTALYQATGCLLLIGGPWLADYLGVKGLAGRIIVTLSGVAVIAVLWCFAFIQLATTWFVAGKAEALYS